MALPRHWAAWPLCTPFVLIALICPIAYAGGPVGLAALEQFERMGEMRPGVRTYQASSHDPTGDNDDRNFYLAQEGNENVLLDVEGPGCITRIWLTVRNYDDDGMFRIYFDGESTPTVEMTIEALFSGEHDPFVPPLVGNWLVSSGGYYCYVPMMFREGCKITMTSDAIWNYYNVQYQMFDTADGVTTFTGNEPIDTVQALWENSGALPGTLTNPQTVSHADLTIPAGGEVTLASPSGAGMVRNIELTIPDMGAVQHRLVTDDGRSFNGHSEFEVVIDPNNQGVKLTRRMNYRTPDQRADVYVDNQYAGYWLTPNGEGGQWRDDSFWIPANLTSGKSTITVRVAFVSAAYDWWNEFYYWVHSRVGWETILTDEIDVGDPTSEAQHNYQVTHTDPNLPQILETRSAHYANPQSPSTLLDDGRSFWLSGGQCEFTMAINPANNGVDLVRRLDHGIGNQRGEVFVQDASQVFQSVGEWYTAGSNPGRYLNSTFHIPSTHTAGRSSIPIRIEFVSSDVDFNEFYYWAYSLVGGEQVLTDTLDVGRADSEAFHNYSIQSQKWSGTAELAYHTPEFDFYEQILSSLRLQLHWDGETTPAVDVPIGPFFGSGLGPAPARAFPMGIDGERLYCYWPMPFESGMVAKLANTGTGPIDDIDAEVIYEPLATPPGLESGRFHTQYRPPTQTTPDRDFVFLEAEGAGHLVGLVQTTFEQRNSNWFLEGDERIYIDGSLTPALYGTGTEDFYNAGWYFANGIFNQPPHGHPFYLDRSTNAATFYRFMISDYIPFNRSICAGIEHGGTNDESVEMETVAYFYKRSQPASSVSDALDVGDSVSEQEHGYEVTGGSSIVSLTDTYEGDDDNVSVSDDGRELAMGGSVEFEMEVSASNNGGMILRRRMDYSVPRQRGEVFIDGTSVGIWYDAGHNPHHRFRDSEFMIPASFTDGKAQVTVRIDNVSSESVWTAYRYQSDVLLPLTQTSGVDFDYDGDVDVVDFALMQRCLSGAGIVQNRPECEPAKLDGDTDVDADDVQVFLTCVSGPNVESDPGCPTP